VPRYPVVVEPVVPAHDYAPVVAVERRSMAVYAQLGGEVCYG